LILLIGIALATPSLAAGLLQPKNGTDTPIQIRDHEVRVVINNGFALTEVDQVFHNPSDRDLDAVYTFPLPRDASLSELSLWIDGVEVVGEVVEKERAREIHRGEADAGRETALAEQRDYYAFDVSVSPVRAGSDTRVRLVYLQPVEIDSGVGRYVYPLEEGKIDEEVHAFWDLAPEVHGRFDFHCTVRSSYPLSAVRATGYESVAAVEQSGDDTWTVRIESEDGSVSLNRDVVVYYRLVEGLPARVDLLPYRTGDGPGTYLLVVTPGNDLQEITEGVDWSVVLDVSGSMADKIAVAGDAVARAVGEMRPGDRVRIAVFNDRAWFVAREWLPVNEVTVSEVRERMASIGTGGSTNLHAGFELGLRGLEEDRTSAVILVSDGGANAGPTTHRDFLDLLADTDVRVFTFTIGQGSNRPLLRTLAEESGGFNMDVSNRDDLYGRILQAKAKLVREAMHGVRVELEGVGASEPAPAFIGSTYHGQQIVQLGRYAKPGEAKLRVRARISGEDRSWETRVVLPEYDDAYPEIERMWALARIEDLMQHIRERGEDSEARDAVVDVATGYSIVTDYTSMIVVREDTFEEHGIDRRNRDRVERERTARVQRMQQPVRQTRADSKQPMYGNKSSHGLGGGAVGPLAFGLMALAALGAARLRRTRR
jgi:Ca-activated chloride channel family protein